MTEISDDIQDDLDELADKHGKDYDDLEALYEKKLERIKETDVIGIEEDDYPEKALATVRSNLQRGSRAGSIGPSGDVEEIPIAAVGNVGRMAWSNGDVVIAHGIVAPPDTDDENRLPGVGIIIMDEDSGVDLTEARKMFRFGNHVRGWFTVDKLTDSFQERDREYYVLGAPEESKIQEADFDSLPSGEEFVQFVNENYIQEEVTLDTLADNLSEEGEEFGSQWLDLRRFEGQVLDSYRDDEKDFGNYVLTDETYASQEEMEDVDELVDADDIENGRTLGLNVWMAPEHVVYGDDSTVVVYGTLSQDDETGKIVMNGTGVAGLIGFPREGNSGGGDHDDTEVDEI